MNHIISKSFDCVTIDSVSLETNGVLRVVGWFKENFINVIDAIEVYLNGNKLKKDIYYTVSRPDVVQAIGIDQVLCGFVLEYLVKAEECKHNSKISVHYRGEEIFIFKNKTPIRTAHYNLLLETRDVLHRENIYCSGNPTEDISPELIDVLENINMKGRTLDFGCGKGPLVRKMRQWGIEAYGIELKREAIVNNLDEEVKQYITLFDGSFPLPFSDNEFANIVCIEVLEHVKDYEGLIDELMRVGRKKLILTVPDAAAIPMLHQHEIVPWHLMESTHFNFFTYKSLYDLLNKKYSKVELSKMHPTNINGTIFFNHLLAVCTK